MVIHHFNRIIRNKWVWGVFAVLISMFFAFDFIFDSRNGDRGAEGAGKMVGKKVSSKDFEEVRQDIQAEMRFQYGRDIPIKPAQLNEDAWSRLAMLQVAKDLKLTATDDEVRAAILQGFKDETGSFNAMRYQETCERMGWRPERFEAFLRRQLSMRPVQKVTETASWVSPLEISNVVRDQTDKITVRVARFQQKNANAIKLDDAAFKEYYEANTNSLALPELKVIRYVKVLADDAASLAKVEIDEDELRDYYEKTSDRYGTNTFEAVRAQVEREFRLKKSVENASDDLYTSLAEGGDEKLAALAREKKLEVKTSRPFSLSRTRIFSGFMVEASSVLPGAQDFNAMVAELDPNEPSAHYRVIAASNAVYVITLDKDRCTEPRVLTFDEVKGDASVRSDALNDLKAKKFKAEAEKICETVKAGLAKGTDAKFDGLFNSNVSTSITVNVSTSLTFVAQTAMQAGTIPDAYSVVPAAIRLTKGEMSELVVTRLGHGLVVYVEDRQPGVAGDAFEQVRKGLSRRQAGLAVQAWNESNMARLGVQPSSWTSMKEFADGDNADDGEGSQD